MRGWGIFFAPLLAIGAAACWPAEQSREPPLTIETDLREWRHIWPDAEVMVIEQDGRTYTIPIIPGMSVGVRQTDQGPRYHLTVTAQRIDPEPGLNPYRLTGELMPVPASNDQIVQNRWQSHLDRPDLFRNHVDPAVVAADCVEPDCVEGIWFGATDCRTNFDRGEPLNAIGLFQEFQFLTRSGEHQMFGHCSLLFRSRHDPDMLHLGCTMRYTGAHAHFSIVNVQSNINNSCTEIYPEALRVTRFVYNLSEAIVSGD